jgi:VCBS repeat-containing protein
MNTERSVRRFVVGFVAGASALLGAATVLASGLPPVAKPDSDSATAGQTIHRNAPGVLANDTDPEGDALTATLLTPPTFGSVTLSSNGSWTYHAGPNAGVDAFTYRANDGTMASNPAPVHITVSAAAPTPTPTPAPTATSKPTPKPTPRPTAAPTPTSGGGGGGTGGGGGGTGGGGTGATPGPGASAVVVGPSAASSGGPLASESPMASPDPGDSRANFVIPPVGGGGTPGGDLSAGALLVSLLGIVILLPLLILLGLRLAERRRRQAAVLGRLRQQRLVGDATEIDPPEASDVVGWLRAALALNGRRALRMRPPKNR